MKKPTANSAFIKGFRYLFWLCFLVFSALFVFSVSLSLKGELKLVNFLMGYSGIVLLSFVISFFSTFYIIKKGIEDGDVPEGDILKKDSKLNINIFKK